jgi:hypothetical protein
LFFVWFFVVVFGVFFWGMGVVLVVLGLVGWVDFFPFLTVFESTIR